MSKMSHKADLSMVYTNHSICSTGITFLKRNKYSDKQIMSISGHKSTASLAIYQKVSSDEKLSMGMSMSIPVETVPIQQQQNAVVRYEPEDPVLQEFQNNTDFDVSSILESIEKENFSMTQTRQNENVTTTMMQRQMVHKSSQVPIFKIAKLVTSVNFMYTSTKVKETFKQDLKIYLKH